MDGYFCTMKRIGIEETLLEYHKVTGKNWNYSIQPVDKLPEDAIQVRSVRINGSYIQFYEKEDFDTRSSVVFWALESA